MNDEKPPGSSHQLPYPTRGSLDRLIYKLPLLLWRMGLGVYFSHPARGGSRMLVLTTRGRKSGKPRHTMVSAVSVEGKDYILSGWGPRSQWVKNINQDPLVTVQVFRRSYHAFIRQITNQDEFSRVVAEMFHTGGDSHFKTWLQSLGIEYSPADMVSKRARITMYGFEPADREGPAPLKANLVWIYPALLAISLGIAWLLMK
ncbi:MAG: nitroreductase family deazaflavin-dependent oxidoreductase [Anaerolineales bacterium]